MLASSYPFLDIMWSMFIFFGLVIWFWFLITILADNFRRDDQSGWAKAGWTVFVIFLPLIGALVYIGVRPNAPLTS
ncbi:MAG TPA: PLDc N-terminal domain-containing protein [Gaiellaceae bacterium]|nr:PLDc N-terminal domain-containing protein [Gaiellaceae bacterium]